MITSLNRAAVSLVLASGVMLAACTLEPDYQRPVAPVAATWTEGASAASSNATVADIGWRDFFIDPALQRLIELALANNRDLRVAALNVQAAQAQYRIQRSDLFPAIDASGVEQVEKVPAGVSGTGSSAITRYFDVGVGFTSYEIDLFGRIRSLDHAALETYFGYQETRRSSQLSLVAEVASAYFTVLADQANLDVSRGTLDSQSASEDLTRRSLDAGVGTALSLNQVQITVETARANVFAYTRQLAQDRNALALLIGTALPDDLDLGASLAAVQLVGDLPEGVPSQVLAQRPDVLVAEHQLIAANADIGAARAAFYPSISLTGSFGTASTQLSGLFKDGSSTWTFEPQINIPIFNAGANAANLDVAKIQKSVEIAQYEKTLQNAFKEVDDALTARASIDGQLGAERALKDAADQAYTLAQMRFKAGVDSYLPVLTAQQTLYGAQQELVALQLLRLQNLATLYKALGGGLQEHSATAAASP